jgi:predicted ester cyclase
MSVEQNKAVTRRTLEDVMNKGNVSLIPELFAANYVHRVPGGREIKGHDGWKQMVLSARTAFPDLRYTIDELVGEGDTVVCRGTSTGTHKGDYGGIAPTGKRITSNVIFINRFEGGKVAETWAPNGLSIYQQLGVIPLVLKQTEEKNKAAIRRIVDEVWNKRNLAALPEVQESDFVMHAAPQDTKGLEAVRATMMATFKGFPDLVMKLDDIVAEGDRVAWRFTLTGTHKGEYMGLAPTGKRIKVQANLISRCSNGKEAESWAFTDMHTIYQQLGVKAPA